MLSDYQLKIADLSNISIYNVKKVVPNLFYKEKYVIHFEDLQLYLRLGLKLRNMYCVLEFNHSQWLKQYVEFNTHKKIEAEKNVDKDWKALYKLINNAAYGIKMENLRNRTDVKLVSNKKDYLKWISNPSYMSYKIFDNDLVTICENKVALTLNKHTVYSR